MKLLPFTVRELIYELNKMYPDRCPNLIESDREIWFKAGQRDVVNALVHRLQYEEEHTTK